MFDLNRLLHAISSGAEISADFQRMLEWKLLRGSHEFPGPEGGTCVNEAAIVAAGYPYRPVYCVKDMPPSFSRPLATLALCLNDTLDDALRQQLLKPFVTRLAGTADTAQVELDRAELMMLRTIVEIIAPALARAGCADLAQRARLMRSPVLFIDIVHGLHSAGRRVDQHLLSACEHVADAIAHWHGALAAEAVFCTFSAMREIALLDGEQQSETVYRRAAAILDAALELGAPGQREAAEVVARRMQAAKGGPTLVLAREDDSLLA
ncbi:MAG: hypothetical protein ACJ8F3_02790 [Xanthobacteraceae bacterium]